jgi:hypothetical protein
MNYQPNEDAVLFFANSALPLVRRQLPDLRFLIAGKSLSACISALNGRGDVLGTGYVRDERSCSAHGRHLSSPSGWRRDEVNTLSHGC